MNTKITIDEKGTKAIIKSYFKNKGLDVEIEIKSLAEYYYGSFEYASSMITIKGNTKITGIDAKYEKTLSNSELKDIVVEMLKDENMEICDVKTQSEFEYVGMHEEKVARFRGIVIEVKELKDMKSL